MDKNSLAIIKRALNDIDKYEIKRMEPRAIHNMPDAEKFDEKVLAIIAKNRTTRSFSSKRFIAALIAAAILLSAAITVYAFREPIKDFFIEKFGTHDRYSYNGATPSPIADGIYQPTWLPNDYKQTTYNESVYAVQTMWSDGANRIILNQKTASTSSGSFDTENAENEIITINSQKYYYTSKNGVHSLVWMNEKYIFTLWCTNITKDDALKIATSLKVEKDFPKE